MSKTKNKKKFLIIAIATFSISSCSHLPKSIASGLPAVNYSNPALEAINWKKILPPPPQTGSELDKIELDLVINANALKGTPRWNQAVNDAGLDQFTAFGAVLGTGFNKDNYPEIASIFDIVLKYSFNVSKASKNIYDRKRPFLVNDKIATCPNSLANGSSYPSGHSAIGWVNGQILSRIFPQYADDLMARGIDYGQSRMICGVHFPSDIVSGRIVGDVMLQKLEQDAEFTKLLQSAQEKAKLNGKSAKN